MFRKPSTIIVGLAVGIGTCFFPAGTTHAISTFTGDTTVNPSGFSDLIANPDDFFSWDQTNITYQFDSNFTADSRIRDQIRLAFHQWDTANATASGATYSYIREAGSQPFGDIRSIAVHEIGHVLGLSHTNLAAAVSRNYGLGAGGALVVQADQGNEVMRSFLNQGDYNHTLSHDELDAFDYVYGRDLNFTEVASGGNIIIRAGIVFPPIGGDAAKIWATGFLFGDYRIDSTLGGLRATTGSITLNSTAALPLGLKTLGINWDYSNVSGGATSSFEIVTRGTNNPTPIFRYDGFPAHRFNDYASSAVGADVKEDLLHTWSDPTGGPFDGVVHVGLEQDVWDWTVVSAQVVNSDGTRTNAPLLSFHDWNQTLTVDAALTESAEGITFADEIRVGTGFRLVNTLNATSQIVEVAIGNVAGLNLQLADLNRQTLQSLLDSGRVSFLDMAFPTLDDGEQVLFLFDGNADDFPGTVIPLNRPDLLNTELFVYAKSRNGDAEVGTYALLGRDVIVPEPSSFVLAALGLAGLGRSAWQRRRRA